MPGWKDELGVVIKSKEYVACGSSVWSDNVMRYAQHS